MKGTVAIALAVGLLGGVLGGAVGGYFSREDEVRRLEAHIYACREVVDGERLLPPCHCGGRDESIEASCTRADYAHYEILWRAEEILREGR